MTFIDGCKREVPKAENATPPGTKAETLKRAGIARVANHHESCVGLNHRWGLRNRLNGMQPLAHAAIRACAYSQVTRAGPLTPRPSSCREQPAPVRAAGPLLTAARNG